MSVKLKTHNKVVTNIQNWNYFLSFDVRFKQKKSMVRNILIAFCVILFVSCSKDTESKLFGKWQLQKVEANGDVQNVDTVYFNLNILCLCTRCTLRKSTLSAINMATTRWKVKNIAAGIGEQSGADQ